MICSTITKARVRATMTSSCRARIVPGHNQDAEVAPHTVTSSARSLRTVSMVSFNCCKRWSTASAKSIEIGLRIGQPTELHVNPNIASNDGHAGQVRGRVVDGRAPEDSTHGMSHRRPRGTRRLHRRCPEANAASELLPRVVEPDDRRQHAPRLEEDPAQEEDQRRFRHSPAA
jgi:hypothetical protein